jgi:hypothetical protein
MKTYRISEVPIEASPNTIVELRFRKQTIVTRLAQVPSELKRAKLTSRMPEAILCMGTKVGAFPTIACTDESSAMAMSTVAGYPIEKGDGVRFATSKQARSFAMELFKLHTDMSSLQMQWMISKPEAKSLQTQLVL